MIIKRRPEEFEVEERLTAAWWSSVSELPGPSRRLALYEVTKRSVTTPDAAFKLAASLGISTGDVSYAGMKDRHAHTKQHMTAAAPRGMGGSPREVGGEGWNAVRVGWSASHLDARAIESNRFRIVARGLSERACTACSDRAHRFSVSGGLVFPNLFGRQRFGSARHGRGYAGRALIDGDFEQALRLLIGTPARKDEGSRRRFVRLVAERWGDWSGILESAPRCPERRAIESLANGHGFREAFTSLPYLTQQLSVEAYQSHLWNRAVASLLWARAGGHAPQDEVTTIANERLPLTVARPDLQRLTSCQGELPHAGMGREGEWGGTMGAVLEADGLDAGRLFISGLRRPAFGAAVRPICALASGLSFTRTLDDQSGAAAGRAGAEHVAHFEFELPRGAYATALLEWLLNGGTDTDKGTDKGSA